MSSTRWLRQDACPPWLARWLARADRGLRSLMPLLRRGFTAAAGHDFGAYAAYAGTFLKYDLERTLLAAALVFVALLSAIPEMAAAPAVQGVLAIFATDTPHLKISGTLGLALGVAGLCWLLNEVSLAFYPMRSAVGRRWQLLERHCVPVAALGGLAAPWLLESLPRPSGENSGPLAVLTSYLLLQLVPAAVERVRAHAAATTDGGPFAALRAGSPTADGRRPTTEDGGAAADGAATAEGDHPLPGPLEAPARRELVIGLGLAPLAAAWRALFGRAPAPPGPVLEAAAGGGEVPAEVAAPAAIAVASARPPYQDIRQQVANAGRQRGRMDTVRWLAVHHSGTTRGDGFLFVNMHPSWENAPYHYVVLPDGTIQWLQDLTVPSFHAGFDSAEPGMEEGQLYNNHAISTCLVGNFDVSRPTAAQLAALRRHLTDLMARYSLGPERVLGHNELRGAHRTACPGRGLDVRTLRVELSRARSA